MSRRQACGAMGLERIVPLILVLTIMFAGCARLAEPSLEHTEGNAGKSKLLPRPFAAKVPAALVMLDRQSQVLYYQVKAKDWPGATQQMVLVLDTARKLQKEVGEQNEYMSKLDNTLELLGTAIQRREQDMALSKANTLTLVMANMSRHYKRQVPVEVSLLGYYGRKLQSISPHDSVNFLAGTTLEMTTLWQNLRPTVLSNGGWEEVRHYDALMRSLAAAQTPQDFDKVGRAVVVGLNDLGRTFLTEPSRR